MMKTALSIIQTTMYRMNESAPTSLVTSVNKDTRQLLHLLYEVCELIRAQKCWDVQKRKHTITISSSDVTAERTQYPLPQDFYAPVPETFFNDSEDLPMNGPVNDSNMAWRLYGNAPGSLNYTYRIFGMDANPSTTAGQIELNPTPSAEQTLKLEYQSRTFILPSTYSIPTAPGETVSADTDLVVFDSDLVIQGLKSVFKRETGGDWQPDYQLFKDMMGTAGSRMKASYIGSMGSSSGRPRYRQPYRSWESQS